MIKITKEMCENQAKDKWQSICIYIILIAIFVTVKIFRDSDSIWWLVACIGLFGTVTVALYYILRKKLDITANNGEFYIVEDVFINVHEINVFTNRFNRYTNHYDYQIKFSRNGIHNIKLFSKKEPEEIEEDYSAVFFSKPGDKFYLMIKPGEKEDIILKCYNAKYYSIYEDDFDYIDGKYYPKKDIA